VLHISCSCLASSSPSKVWQFKFEYYPQVKEISSVVHYLSCFGGGFSLCLFTGISALGAYFFALPPFFWGRFSVPSAPSADSMLLWFTGCFFSFVGQVDFGCCSLAQEMSSVIHYLLCFGECLVTSLLLAFLPFQCLFSNSLH
jgi:hypothetical protein